MFELGSPNRTTGKFGRVALLSFICSVCETPGMNTPEQQRLTLRGSRADRGDNSRCFCRETEHDGVILFAFLIPSRHERYTKTSCSLLKARDRKQQTLSTGGHPDLGLDRTPREGTSLYRGLYSLL